MANEAVTEFTQRHSLVAGVILIAIGVAGVIGSVSGNLASMLAALVDPLDLDTVSQAAGVGGPPPVTTAPNPPGEPGNPPGAPTGPALPGGPEPIGPPSPPGLPGVPELPIIGA